MIIAIRIVEKIGGAVAESYSPDQYMVQCVSDSGETFDVVALEDGVTIEHAKGR